MQTFHQEIYNLWTAICRQCLIDGLSIKLPIVWQPLAARRVEKLQAEQWQGWPARIPIENLNIFSFQIFNEYFVCSSLMAIREQSV